MINQCPLVREVIFLFCSSQQPSRVSLGPLKDFLNWQGALQGPSTCFVHCFWKYRETRTPPAGHGGHLGHHQRQLTQTLVVRLLKTHFLHRSLILKSQQNRIELVARPGRDQSVEGPQEQANMVFWIHKSSWGSSDLHLQPPILFRAEVWARLRSGVCH